MYLLVVHKDLIGERLYEKAKTVTYDKSLDKGNRLQFFTTLTAKTQRILGDLPPYLRGIIPGFLENLYSCAM